MIRSVQYMQNTDFRSMNIKIHGSKSETPPMANTESDEMARVTDKRHHYPKNTTILRPTFRPTVCKRIVPQPRLQLVLEPLLMAQCVPPSKKHPHHHLDPLRKILAVQVPVRQFLQCLTVSTSRHILSGQDHLIITTTVGLERWINTGMMRPRLRHLFKRTANQKR